jgi:hypothetical protein
MIQYLYSLLNTVSKDVQEVCTHISLNHYLVASYNNKVRVAGMVRTSISTTSY